MCRSIISAVSISFMRWRTHCSGAGSLVIVVLLLVGECVRAGNTDFGRPRSEAVNVAPWRPGRSRSADDLLESGHLRQPGRRLLIWHGNHGAGIAPLGEPAAALALGVLRSALILCLLEHGLERDQPYAAALGNHIAQFLKLACIEIGGHGEP